jgi:hypothetical protein
MTDETRRRGLSASLRSARTLRRVVSLSAAGALALATLPAGVAAQETSQRITDPPCDGAYDSTFDDIDGSAHEEQVLCMANEGLTEGTRASDGESYAPRREVTRAQMASFIARFIERYADRELPAGDPDRFDDVPSDFVHADNITKLAALGVVEGTSASDGQSYAPQAGITRAQMASLIRRALSFLDDGQVNPLSAPPATADDFFGDDDGSVHENNINALADVGIVAGFRDGTYRPAENVLRDQMASFVMRGFNFALVEDLGADRAPQQLENIELSWFDEVSTEPGETFDEDDVFATGDAGAAGDNGAEGVADLDIDPLFNTVTYRVAYDEVTGPFGAAPGLHVHAGHRDENGPVVVFLATGDELDAHADDGEITGTVAVDRAEFDVNDLLTDPESHYVNLHSDDFPAGAIRGQLDGPASIAAGDVTSRWQLTATADEVVDGGQPGAEATFDLTFDSTNNVVCYEIETAGFAPGGYQSPAHTSTHIHEGDEGEGGPPRVAFRNPTGAIDADGDQLDPARSSSGCHLVPQQTGTAGDDGVDNGVGFDLAEIEADPEGFYVDIHTEANPEGAVRAQFRPQDRTDDGGATVETEVALNWQSEVADVDGGDFTAARGQDSFDADGVDADRFFGDVDDTAASGLADDGSGELTLRWNSGEGATFLRVEGTFTVSSPVADDAFDGFPIHIHSGELEANGPVEIPLATPTDVESVGDLGGDRELLEYTVSQTVTAAELEGLADALADIESEMAAADEGDVLDVYVNVHTEDNVPGELRGHLQAINLLAGETGDIDGGLSQLPPVFKQIGVEAGGIGSLVTLTFDTDVQLLDILDPDDFRLVVDGVEQDVATATAVNGSIQLTTAATPDEGDEVEVTILDGAAEQIEADGRDDTATNSVRVRATTAG